MTSIGSYSEEPNILLYNNPQQIPTAQNWGELTQLLAEPPNTIVLSPDGSFFAVNPRTMNVLLHVSGRASYLINRFIGLGVCQPLIPPGRQSRTWDCTFFLRTNVGIFVQTLVRTQQPSIGVMARPVRLGRHNFYTKKHI